MNERFADDYERSAGGLDFDGDTAERARRFGKTLLSEGPEALLDEVENLVPDSWREQITHFPMTAVLLGFGVGVFLGMKKGDELLGAGTAMISAAAAANLSDVLSGLD